MSQNSEWKMYSYQQQVEVYRSGWRGVWDALVAAITGKPRLLVVKPITISFWAKHNADVRIANTQVEGKPE